METHKKFWTYKETAKGYELDIDTYKFIEFLEKNGFRNFEIGLERWLVHLENNVLRRIKGFYINTFAKEYLKNLPEQLEHGFTRNDLIELFHKKIFSLVHREQLHTLEKINPVYKRDTATTSYKFFKNGFVEITRNKVALLNYDKLDAIIWESQKIKRDFEPMELTTFIHGNEFYQFLWNCMGHNESRLYSLISVIGYLIHTHKNPANAKAIIFCDEKISEIPEGGSGKSLTLLAIAKFVKTAFEDGKTFKVGGAFAFQQCEFDTKLIVIDDVVKKFDFEPLFTPITAGIIIEKKHQGKIHISSEDSPKFALTTNYMIQGKGNSFERRKMEIEFSTFYNENKTPELEFGHRFFDDWNDKQWAMFDNFMLYCIQFHIKNGIIDPPKINLKHRKIFQDTNKDFVEFADTIVRNKEHNKQSIFTEFTCKYPDFQHMKQRTFTDWLKLYADYAEDICTMNDRHSNLDRFFIFIQKPLKINV